MRTCPYDHAAERGLPDAAAAFMPCPDGRTILVSEGLAAASEPRGPQPMPLNLRRHARRPQSTTRWPTWVAVFAATLALLVVRSAPGASDGAIQVELNKLEPSNGDCRAYLVLMNESTSAFEALKLDVVIFGTDGVVERRLAVQAAPLPPGKTSLKVFDVGGLPCERIGRLLLNDVLDCAAGAGPRDDCLTLLSTTARAAVPFIK